MNPEVKSFAEKMPKQDLVYTGMALRNQALNFLIMVNEKIQTMDVELNLLRVILSSFARPWMQNI